MAAASNNNQALERATSQSALAPYLNVPLKLWILDAQLLTDLVKILKKLGFSTISATSVVPDFELSQDQLIEELTGNDGMILVNHPPKKIVDGEGNTRTVLGMTDFLQGLTEKIKAKGKNPKKYISRVVPVFVTFQDADRRARLIQDLVPFGIMGAFMLKEQAKLRAKDVQFEERVQEIYDYFVDYFMQSNHQLKHFKDYKTAEELKALREETEKILAEAKRLRELGDYDRAIAMCRKATELLPQDPEAYLEGGRMLVKKKKYAPAFQMFRDAEAVAEDLPTPNQEIANMRVTQVRDLMISARKSGKKPDQDRLDNLLKEAVENFQSALDKAAQIPEEDPERREAKRQDATTAILENMLTTGLTDALKDNPHVQELMGLAQGTLAARGKAKGGLPAKYRVQLGLLTFFKGDLGGAVKELLAAAQAPEAFHEAAMKLNYIGTQLRQRNQTGQAIEVYTRLRELKPSFQSVVLFNLAVAKQTQAYNLRSPGSPEHEALEREGLGFAVEALVLDPYLPRDPNFYHNTVMAPVLKKGAALLSAAEQDGRSGLDPTARANRLAMERLEELIRQGGKDRECITMLLDLAQKLPSFFLKFDQHASPEVQRFAQRLVPLLGRQKDPRMLKLGKILGVLVEKGQRAAAPRPAQGAVTADPRLARAVAALAAGEQAAAARELALALWGEPGLFREKANASDTGLRELLSRASEALSAVRLEAFQTGKAA